MKSIFEFLIICGVVTILCGSTARADVTCPPKPAAPVNIIWGSDNIKYDFSRSQSQMDNMNNDTQSPYGNNAKTHVGGLMKGGISVQSQVQVATMTYPRARQMCQWVDRVDVNIKIDPTIYISRDHKPGSCRHKAIMEHEMKHIYTDREIVKKYVPIIQSALSKAVVDIGIVGPKDMRDQARYQKQINDYIAREVKNINTKLNTERRQRQQAIDSRQEYDRVAAMCKN